MIDEDKMASGILSPQEVEDYHSAKKALTMAPIRLHVNKAFIEGPCTSPERIVDVHDFEPGVVAAVKRELEEKGWLVHEERGSQREPIHVLMICKRGA